MTSEYILKLASRASELFESSELQEKRLLLKMTLQNLELKGKKAQFDWIKPFDAISLLASRQTWLGDRNFNITSQFVRAFKVFEDFRFINQLKEDMDKVRPAVAMAT